MKKIRKRKPVAAYSVKVNKVVEAKEPVVEIEKDKQPTQYILEPSSFRQ